MAEQAGRVLVVDDDPQMRLSVEGVLSLEFEVHTAASVADAEQLLAKEKFDVVLTDYDMPGASGIELTRTLSRTQPEVMVILLTGHPEVAEVRQAETAQAIVRVLTKPYDPRRLIHWVSSTVKLARLRRSLSTAATGRRAAPRVEAVLKVSYPPQGANGDHLSNLAPGGCFLRTSRPLELGQVVRLGLSFPGALETLELDAQVRWRASGERAGAGMAFVDVPPAVSAKLTGLLARLGHGAKHPTRVAFLVSPALKQAYSKSLHGFLPPSYGEAPIEIAWADDHTSVMAAAAHPRTRMLIADGEASIPAQELISRARSLSGQAKLPVVLLQPTGGAAIKDPDVMELRKPVDVETLLRTIGALLS